jgi:hypothetical protein
MGRPKKQNREPFWRSDRKCYYFQVGTRQQRLSPDKDEAWRLWHEFMARPPAPAPVFKPGPDTQAIEILDAFLDWCQKHKAPRTYNWYRDFFQYLTRHIPSTLKVAELKPFHLTQAMDAKPDWSNNTRHDFVTAVKRAFNWALDEEMIERNPVARPRSPSARPGRRSSRLTSMPSSSKRSRNRASATWSNSTGRRVPGRRRAERSRPGSTTAVASFSRRRRPRARNTTAPST